MVGEILAALLGLLLLAAIAALLWRGAKQRANARAREIRSPNGISEASFVRIGGIEQWIEIRGEDQNNPVLLMLSGGPGNSLIPLGYTFLRPWEKAFTVVNWDQRGSGRTFVRYGQNCPDLSIARMVADTIEVAEYLCRRLGKSKIVLLGWSWGSILGIEAIHARPDLFAAYVGTGQFVEGEANEAVGYTALLARAEAANDTKTVTKLKKIGPPPYPTRRKLIAERRLLPKYTPPLERAFWKRIPAIAAFAPGYSLLDTYRVGLGAALFSLKKLWPSVSTYDARKLTKNFQVPFFIINGEDDIQVPTTIARDWFETLSAPQKEFITIRGAAHLALATHSAEFFEIMLKRVSPSLATSE
jgi:proline iminopeptidase